MEFMNNDICKIIYKYIYDCVLSEVMEVRFVYSKQDRFLLGMRSCFYLLKDRYKTSPLYYLNTILNK